MSVYCRGKTVDRLHHKKYDGVCFDGLYEPVLGVWSMMELLHVYCRMVMSTNSAQSCATRPWCPPRGIDGPVVKGGRASVCPGRS